MVLHPGEGPWKLIATIENPFAIIGEVCGVIVSFPQGIAPCGIYFHRQIRPDRGCPPRNKRRSKQFTHDERQQGSYIDVL